jgi:O-Antigen ligase
LRYLGSFKETFASTTGEHARAASPLYWALVLLSLLPICVVLPVASTTTGIVAVTSWATLMWIAVAFVQRKFHYIVLVWLSVFPYCYYFFSYPAERSIFTIDRAFILLLVIEIFILSPKNNAVPLSRDLLISACSWGLYLLICFHSLSGHPIFEVLGSYRLLLDGMVMPALLGLYALRFFPVTGNVKRIHFSVCVLMLGIASVAGSELLTGKNLLPWPGSIETWVLTNNIKIIRVDGPFENSSILAVIGTIGFFLIVYSRRLAGGAMTISGRLLHSGGVLASLACALMPMNRGSLAAFLICACLDYVARDSLIRRVTWNCIFVTLILAGVVSWLFYPGLFEDRVTRRDNFDQRVAQDLQTSEVVQDHPLLGVGFNLFTNAVAGDPKYSVRWRGFDAMDVPHNAFLAVMAEEGIVGFTFYLVAQVFWVRAMWRVRNANSLGWRVFLYCVLVYVIVGLDVGIAYFSDLNLFYMLVLGILLQLQLRHSVSAELS